MKSLRRSLAWSFAESYAGMVFQFIATIIIARLITPAELGIFSVATMLAALASVIRDFGVGEYLIQEKNLTDQKIRAAISMSFIMSWSMALLMLLGRDVAVAFYHEPGVGQVMTVQALNFFLIPFGAVTISYLRREMLFDKLFWVNTTSSVIGSIAGIALAWRGYSYMSMAWGGFVSVSVYVLMTLAFRPPKLPRLPGLTGLGEAFTFGWYVSGVYIGGQVGKSMPDLVIGRVLNFTAVGLFGRAVGLIEIFNRSVLRAILPVTLPYYADQLRKGENVRESYLATIVNLTAIAWPFFVVLGILAYPLIDVLYGKQWLAAAPLVGILCLAAAIDATFSMAGEILIASGKAKLALWLQVGTQGIRVAAVVLLAQYGLEAVSWGLLVASIISGGLTHVMTQGCLALKLGLFLRRCIPGLVLTLMVALPVLGLDYFLARSATHSGLRLVFGGLLATSMWLGAILVSHHPLRLEMLKLYHWGMSQTKKIQGEKHA